MCKLLQQESTIQNFCLQQKNMNANGYGKSQRLHSEDMCTSQEYTTSPFKLEISSKKKTTETIIWEIEWVRKEMVRKKKVFLI